MTQTARLSGPFLYGPTDLSCSLATVTHGWGETEEGELWETGFHKDSFRTFCMHITVKTNKTVAECKYKNGPKQTVNNIPTDCYFHQQCIK